MFLWSVDYYSSSCICKDMYLYYQHIKCATVCHGSVLAVFEINQKLVSMYCMCRKIIVLYLHKIAIFTNFSGDITTHKILKNSCQTYTVACSVDYAIFLSIVL